MVVGDALLAAMTMIGWGDPTVPCCPRPRLSRTREGKGKGASAPTPRDDASSKVRRRRSGLLLELHI
jgi:hypothetical protein